MMLKSRSFLFRSSRERAVHAKGWITSSLVYDAVMAALSLWLMGGAYLDGWAHLHIPDMETFFTPWHAVLYSGYLACAVFLFGTLIKNVRNGYPLDQAIPAGYALSIVGAVAFALGGVADLIWHTLFGIEADIEALLSPTHLILAASAALIVTGPLRAAWLRFHQHTGEQDPLPRQALLQRQDLLPQLPAVLSLTLFYSILTLFTEYASPFEETIVGLNRLPANHADALRFQALGVVDFLLQSAILVGIILFFLRRLRFPLGSLTILMTLNTLAMGLMHDGWFSTGTTIMIGVGFLAGLAFDGLHWRLRPSVEKSSSFRWFAFLLPVILYILYYLAIFLFGGGVWWSNHLWVGSILLSGLTGLLLSYAFLPPSLSE